MFSILIPVLFLLLFGSIYKTSGTPRLSVIEVGRVSLLDQAESAAPSQLGKILTMTHSTDLAAALEDVRKGSSQAVVQQQGQNLIVHYSIADQTTAGIVQAVFTSLVQQADAAAAGSKRRFSSPRCKSRTSRSNPSSTSPLACSGGRSRRAARLARPSPW